jgi:hypothetical protein
VSQPDESDRGSSPRGSANVDEVTPESSASEPPREAQGGTGGEAGSGPRPAEPAPAPSRAAAPNTIPERLKPSAGVADRPAPQQRPPRPASTVTVTAGSGSGSSSGTATGSKPAAAGAAAGAATRRGNPRQARLALVRVDPWSVLKLSLVLSVALFVVGLVAVMVLYFVLEGMGVPDALNEMVADVTADPEGGAAAAEVLTLGRVFALSVVVGAVNVVLMTALATLGAFLYNLCADVVGGVDVTLSERE